MNPSSSSNAEPAAHPVFHVRTADLSSDFTRAGVDESPQDLGDLDQSHFEAVLARLAAIDLPPASDADPHLLVKAHRGRFFLRPHRGRWLVQPASSAEHAYVDLGTGEVAPYLAGGEPVLAAPSDATSELPAEPSTPTRTGLILLLAAVSPLALAGSAFLTFQSDDIDPASAYAPLASPDQITAMQVRVVGRFATDSNDERRVLEIRPDGTLTWLEFAADQSVANERRESYSFALRDGQPVLRVAGLGGPVSIHGPHTLVYAHETYSRQP